MFYFFFFLFPFLFTDEGGFRWWLTLQARWGELTHFLRKDSPCGFLPECKQVWRCACVCVLIRFSNTGRPLAKQQSAPSNKRQHAMTQTKTVNIITPWNWTDERINLRPNCYMIVAEGDGRRVKVELNVVFLIRIQTKGMFVPTKLSVSLFRFERIFPFMNDCKYNSNMLFFFISINMQWSCNSSFNRLYILMHQYAQ